MQASSQTFTTFEMDRSCGAPCVNYSFTSTNSKSRCSGDPGNDWGGLGDLASETECAEACLADNTCEYAVFRHSNGKCTKFESCDATSSASNRFTIIQMERGACE